MIKGWESVSLEQQQSWLEDHQNIPDEAFDVLDLDGLNAIHTTVFGEDLTVFGLDPMDDSYREMIIDAIKNDRAIEDSEFRSGVPEDADI